MMDTFRFGLSMDETVGGSSGVFDTTFSHEKTMSMEDVMAIDVLPPVLTETFDTKR